MINRTTPTGTISMDDVRTELKVTGTITLNDTNVRKLAGKASGEISMNDLRGKSNATWVHVGDVNAFAQTQDGTAPRVCYEKAVSEANKYGINLRAFFPSATGDFYKNWGTKTIGNDRIVFKDGNIAGGGRQASITFQCWKFK